MPRLEIRFWIPTSSRRKSTGACWDSTAIFIAGLYISVEPRSERSSQRGTIFVGSFSCRLYIFFPPSFQKQILRSLSRPIHLIVDIKIPKRSRRDFLPIDSNLGLSYLWHRRKHRNQRNNHRQGERERKVRRPLRASCQSTLSTMAAKYRLSRERGST